MEYPKLRPVEAFPIELHGRQVLCLRDPAHVAEAVLCVPLAAVNILRYFDGTRSVIDIQAEYARQNGAILFREQVEKLIAMLDEHYFLDNDRRARHEKALEEAFRRAGTRAAFLADKSYPAEPSKLRQMLDQFLDHPHGPAGQPGHVQAPLRAVIAPHIDYMRGEVGYAWAYRGLLERTDAETFVIFGTAHAGTTKPFAACAKNFETPLGTVPTDETLLQHLQDRCPDVLAVDDIAHRTEHSIELQVVLLQHLVGAVRPIRILPILCDALHTRIGHGKRPSDDPEVQRFLEILRDLLETQERPACLIAGVDLAHMGPRFGDADPITPGLLRWIEDRDRQMLDRVVSGDPDGFFSFVSHEGDRRRICGLSPTYALLHLMRGRTGELLHYGQAADPQGVVTFCSVTFPA